MRYAESANRHGYLCVPPAVRLTNLGIRQVLKELLEAAEKRLRRCPK